MAAIETLEDCISRLPAAVQNQQVSKLHEIAESFTNWQSVVPFLGLDEIQEESIVDDHRKAAIRRLEALRMWSKKYGRNATYVELLSKFHKAQRMDMVERVIEVARSTVGETQTQVPDRTPDGHRSADVPVHRSPTCNPWVIIAVTVIVAGVSIMISLTSLQTGAPMPRSSAPVPPSSAPLSRSTAIPNENTAERESRESPQLMTPPSADKGTEQESRGPLCAKVKDARIVISRLRDITDWRVLGFELGVSETRLNAIDEDENKVEHKRMATIRAWYDATIDAHWDPIIRALINMNKNNIASNIAKEFCKYHDLSDFKNE